MARHSQNSDWKFEVGVDKFLALTGAQRRASCSRKEQSGSKQHLSGYHRWVPLVRETLVDSARADTSQHSGRAHTAHSQGLEQKLPKQAMQCSVSFSALPCIQSLISHRRIPSIQRCSGIWVTAADIPPRSRRLGTFSSTPTYTASAHAHLVIPLS